MRLERGSQRDSFTMSRWTPITWVCYASMLTLTCHAFMVPTLPASGKHAGWQKTNGVNRLFQAASAKQQRRTSKIAWKSVADGAISSPTPGLQALAQLLRPLDISGTDDPLKLGKERLQETLESITLSDFERASAGWARCYRPTKIRVASCDW